MTKYNLFKQDDDIVIISFESDVYDAQEIADTYAKASNYEIIYELEEI